MFQVAIIKVPVDKALSILKKNGSALNFGRLKVEVAQSFPRAFAEGSRKRARDSSY